MLREGKSYKRVYVFTRLEKLGESQRTRGGNKKSKAVGIIRGNVLTRKGIQSLLGSFRSSAERRLILV